ncbi:DMT family transporter [Ancylomarina sp. 16SWW S1-10-2]|uniref:DMT family transporter n=1 Tax=Ancylomarina sp. 16SWW S1-10-2 TaxID=2499681 RepID=UPI0012ADAF1F|nr:DMT family transporter [Ancylomarina sp. 16SWW S1-10-2]MRT91704.1 DMT family transporter [Ancylomarina sp. 16SWW S1-10-2]
MIWKKPWFQFSILLLLAFVWGSSFILMKIGLKSFTNEQVAGIRMLLASLVLLPYSIKNLKYLKKKDVKSLLIAGFIGSFIPAFLFTKAQTQIDSALAGMLNSMTPVFTLLVGILFHRTKFLLLQALGLILGLLGAVGLITSGSGLEIGHVNSYALLIVLATFFYAININEVKARLAHLTGMQITSLAFFFTGPVALIYLLTTDFAPALENPSWPVHLLALAGLGIIGTALAMVLMNSLIRYSSAVYASSVTYIIPIFAIMWGILDGENITPLHLTCMLFILLGVYLTNKKNKLKKI